MPIINIIITITVLLALIFIYKRSRSIKAHRKYINMQDTAYCLIDLNGNINDFNTHFSEFFKIKDKKKTKKMNLNTFLNTRDNDIIKTFLELMIKTKQEKISFDYKFVDSLYNETSSQLTFHLSPVDSKGKFLCLEVTKATGLQNKELKDEMQETDSHKINNLLTIVMGSVQILNIYSNPKGQNEEVARKIIKQVEDAKVAIKGISNILKNKKDKLTDDVA